MNGVKITEKGVVSSLSPTDFILIVTPITANGTTTNDVRRVTVAEFMSGLSFNGVTSVEAGTNEDGESGLVVTYSDNTTDFIQVASGSGGLGIDDWGTTYDAENNVYQLHLYDADGNDLLEPLTMPATGGGSTADSTIKIINRMASRSITFLDTDDGYIEYSVTSLGNEDQQPTGPVRTTWFVDNVQVWSETVSQGNNRFLVKPYLTAGTTSTIRLQVEDNLGTVKPASWTATLTSFSLKWNIASKMASYGSNSLLVRMTPSGSGTNRVIHLTIDEGSEQTFEVGSSSRTVETTIPAQSHGAHTIEAWMTATVDGAPVETEHLVHVGIWTGTSSNAIVGMTIETNPVNQYDNATVNFMVYVPGSETAEVALIAGGNLVNEITVDRSMQTWSFPANTAGNIILGVACNGVTAQDTLVVNEAEVQINPVTVGLVLDLDPTGHNNSEANPELWGYKDANGEMHKLNYTGGADAFDWVNGGFQTDENGSTAFVVRRGNYVTVPYALFGDECENADGKNVKLIYKAVNVRTKNTQIASCLGENGAGIVLRSHSATVSSRDESMTVPYRDEKIIEMDINIQPKSQDSIAVIHLKSAPSAVTPYGSGDTWRAANAMLTIGSEDCDVWIYRLKLYSKNLSDADLLDNYIADCVNATEKRDRASRNNVYSQGTTQINLTALSQRNRELRVIRITAAKMTTSKEDEVLCDVEIVYAAGGEEHHLIAKNVTMKAQGTSSLQYIISALNLDLDFSTCTSWVNGNGTAITEYAMTENSIPVSYFNLKADVASSENANNVVLVDEYNTWNPCKAPGYAQDHRIRDSVEGHPCAVYFTNSGTEATLLGSRMIEPGETALYFVGNMNNSKKNFKVFGQNPAYDNAAGLQCCVEITNNNNDEVVFRKNIGSDELFDGDGNFEFRYPKKPTQAMIDAFKEMHAWVTSTAVDLATGANITATSFDRDPTGTIYYKDSAAYRAAKWDFEVEDYFNTDSLCFHKLFVNHHLLVDNNAKNLFMSYEWDEDKGKYVWNVRCAYDMDTALGTDNSGFLTFHYGMEDTDMVGQNAYVFNANRSTLWINTRDRLADKMQTMYIRLKNQGAWSANRLKARFIAHQGARPEVLVMEDMRNKYILPYTLKQDSDYLKRMQGTKEDQRDEYLTYQEIYSNTRYCDESDRSDVISLRGHTTAAAQGNLEITMFARCYAVVKYGNAGTVKVRITEDGGTAQIVCPASAMDDLEVYCFGASNIVSLGDFSQMRTGSIGLSSAGKLQYLYAGSGEASYENGVLSAMSFGANNLLEVVDIRGLVALTGSLALGNLVSLKRLYATNTGVTGVVFADGSPLEEAYLPNVKSITAKNLNKVQTFAVDPAGIQDLTIENSEGIDTAAIITGATRILSARLIGVNWDMPNADATLRLLNAEGKDAVGNTVPLAVVTGAAHYDVLGVTEHSRLTASFPDLDIDYDPPLAAEHTVSFVDNNGDPLLSVTVRDGENAPEPVEAGLLESAPTKEPTTNYTYEFAGWTDGVTSGAAALTNITGNKTLSPTFSQFPRRYTVRFHASDSILSNVVQTKTVEAGGTVRYDGPDLTPPTGKQWGGWQSLTNNVTSDMDVLAWFISPTAPGAYKDTSQFTYVYSDDPADKDVSAYTFEQFWYVCTAIDDSTGDPVAFTKLNVGDKVKMVANTGAFTDTTIILQLEAFKHFKTEDETGWSNTVWGMIGIMNSTRQMNTGNVNTGGYAAMPIRTWLNGSCFNGLPRNWQCAITPVQVLSSAGSQSTNIVSSIDKLFLRSYTEVQFGSATPYGDEIAAGADSKTFSLYISNTARTKKTYNNTGTAGYWWLRSPYSGNSTYFQIVYSNGGSNNNYASTQYGVSWCFCIGSYTPAA